MSYFDDTANDVTAHEAEMQERMEPIDTEEDRQWAEYYAAMDADYWSPVEQGMYDDDPSPYDGTYSEM